MKSQKSHFLMKAIMLLIIIARIKRGRGAFTRKTEEN